jgi:hypothetical protein
MRIRTVLCGWTTAFVVACHSATAPPAFAGRYRLAAVNGAPLPAPLNTDVEIRSGSLSIGAAGDWMLVRTQHAYINPGPPSTDTLSGRWAASGNDITLYFASTSVVQAVATYTASGVDVVYAAGRYNFVRDDVAAGVGGQRVTGCFLYVARSGMPRQRTSRIGTASGINT